MSLFISGTDTNVGKTFAAAVLMARYRDSGPLYWKPVQTGFPPDDDRRTALELSGLREESFLPTGFTFREPLSPHRAAELEGRELSLDELCAKFREYEKRSSLLVEGAGGLLVPLNRRETWIDFLTELSLPVVLVARTGLGTINHSLLSIEILRRNSLKIVGVLFAGPPNEDNMNTVGQMSGIPVLGRIDYRSAADRPEDIDPNGLLGEYL